MTYFSLCHYDIIAMKLFNLFRIKQLAIAQFLLGSLILSININGNNFFHTKEIFFILFCLNSISHAHYNYILSFFSVIFLYLISAVINLHVGEIKVFDALYYLTGFLYLYLLNFTNKYFFRVIIRTYLISTYIVSLLIVIVWFIFRYYPIFAEVLIHYFKSIETGQNAFLFMIRKRKFLDYWIYGVYYCTTPVLIPALGYYLCKNLKKKEIKNYIFITLFSVALFMSGARANILSVLILLFGYFFLKFIERKKILGSITILTLGSIILLYLVVMLTGDSGESSLMIKSLHKRSYFDVFNSNVIKTFFGGWGAGSIFFSKGFNSFTSLTELSLYETVRRYGLISSLVILFIIWIKPIITIWITSALFIHKAMTILTLLVYIFVGSTNPFLLGSIGFCALLFIVSFFRESNDNQTFK